MNQRDPRQGYILVMTLMIISISVVLVSYMFNRQASYVPFMEAMAQREKAKMLALGGIQLAISALVEEEEAKETTPGEEKKQRSQDEETKKFLARILPSLNRWQRFSLKEEVDGVEGQIHICISCEDGKININEIYDFEKQKFKGEGDPKADYKKIMQELFAQLKESIGRDNLFEPFEKFLKERGYPLDDVTELLTIKEFAIFKRSVFYEPLLDEDKKGAQKKKRPVFLTDLFTIWSNRHTIEPWLFSDSIKGMLGLRRVKEGDSKEWGAMIKGLLKEFKSTVQWSSDWNKFLGSAYEKDFTSLPKSIESILSTKVEAKTFTVLSYGKAGEIGQKLLAIVQREKGSKDKSIPYDVKVKKIYWI